MPSIALQAILKETIEKFNGDKNKSPLTFFRSLLEAYNAYLESLSITAYSNLHEVKNECLTILRITYAEDNFKNNLLNSLCALDSLLTYNGFFSKVEEDIVLLLTLFHQHSPDFIKDPKFKEHYKGHLRLRIIVANQENLTGQVNDIQFIGVKSIL